MPASTDSSGPTGDSVISCISRLERGGPTPWVPKFFYCSEASKVMHERSASFAKLAVAKFPIPETFPDNRPHKRGGNKCKLLVSTRWQRTAKWADQEIGQITRAFPHRLLPAARSHRWRACRQDRDRTVESAFCGRSGGDQKKGCCHGTTRRAACRGCSKQIRKAYVRLSVCSDGLKMKL